jgi:hypothetical protein
VTAIITLLTDFGQRDSYVAEVKGVLLSAAPGVQIVDITHEIAPGNIFAAQYVLGRTWQRFPPGTVHLAVVDPTVGTRRRIIAAMHHQHRFVAPDNGLLTPVLAGASMVEVPVPAEASPTFHGRDVMAPVAALLARGSPLERVGRVISNPIRTPLPTPRPDPQGMVGCVVYVDRFGTLVTNLRGSVAPEAGETLPTENAAKRPAGAGVATPGAAAVVAAGHAIPLRRTFADVTPGELVAFVGSGGTIEIALRDGSASERLGVKEGVEVRLRA